jgi:hypothetical protein
MLLFEDWELWVMQADAGDVLAGCGMVVTRIESQETRRGSLLRPLRLDSLSPLLPLFTRLVKRPRSEGGREEEEEE